jgi:hypothetical protein
VTTSRPVITMAAFVLSWVVVGGVFYGFIWLLGKL